MQKYVIINSNYLAIIISYAREIVKIFYDIIKKNYLHPALVMQNQLHLRDENSIHIVKDKFIFSTIV